MPGQESLPAMLAVILMDQREVVIIPCIFRPFVQLVHFAESQTQFLDLSLFSLKEDQGIYVGSLDSDLRQRIVTTEFAAVYAAGQLVYVQDATLVAQPFDAAGLSLSGEPVAILNEEVDRTAGALAGGAASFASSAMDMAYVSARSAFSLFG